MGSRSFSTRFQETRADYESYEYDIYLSFDKSDQNYMHTNTELIYTFNTVMW